jgi:hypothetical protein
MGERPARRQEGEDALVSMMRDGEAVDSRGCGVANGRDVIECGGGAPFTQGTGCTDEGAVEGVEDLGGEGVDLSGT